MKSSLTSKVSVTDLIDYIPDDVIENLAVALQTDKWIKKLKSNTFFKLILFSLLDSERLSLRIMEENYNDPVFQSLAPTLDADKIVHTGIRDRLMNINCDLFKGIYENLYQQVSLSYKQRTLSGYNIKRYDSTMIATFSHLLTGMRVGNTSFGKTQVKLTTEFTNDFFIGMNFFKDQGHLSEETALKETITGFSNTPISGATKEQSIHVFDKGLKSRKTFEDFDNDSIAFVTRLTETPRYELIKPNLVANQGDCFYDTDELEFIHELTVKLYLSGHGKLTDNEFRLVQFYVKDKSKETQTLSFLTNVNDLTAFDIAQIYKKRWDIEVLFRFMKQEMNLTHFVCNDQNAIMVMVYCTMIASMLVLLYKKHNNIKSYKIAKTKFFKELLYATIADILEHPEQTNKFKGLLTNYIKTG